MPQRLIRTIPSEEVQGEGSWVRVRSLTLGEARRILSSDLSPEEVGREFLRLAIVEWNWADFDGNPLPQVSDDPAVLDQITAEEYEFLSRVLAPNPKN